MSTERVPLTSEELRHFDEWCRTVERKFQEAVARERLIDAGQLTDGLTGHGCVRLFESADGSAVWSSASGIRFLVPAPDFQAADGGGLYYARFLASLIDALRELDARNAEEAAPVHAKSS